MIHSRQIEAFRAVMLTGAMTGAAAAIGITQPAVSRLIRDLEAATGLELFHRRGNLVTPTLQAEHLLAEVERSFVGLERITAVAQELRTGHGGKLRIAALPAMAAGFLPRFVAEYSRREPRLQIVLDGLPSSLVRERVVAGAFDLGITSYPFRSGSLAITPLGDSAVVVMPPDHPLAALEIVRMENLRGAKLILLDKFQPSNLQVNVALQSITHRAPIVTSLAGIACVLVQEGLGVTVVDPYSASEFIGRGLVQRPFDQPSVMGTAIIHSSHRPMLAVAQNFQQAFLRHARNFLRQSGLPVAAG